MELNFICQFLAYDFEVPNCLDILEPLNQFARFLNLYFVFTGKYLRSKQHYLRTLIIIIYTYTSMPTQYTLNTPTHINTRTYTGISRHTLRPLFAQLIGF